MFYYTSDKRPVSFHTPDKINRPHGSPSKNNKTTQLFQSIKKTSGDLDALMVDMPSALKELDSDQIKKLTQIDAAIKDAVHSLLNDINLPWIEWI